MKGRQTPSREVSSKTLSKLNLEHLSKDSCALNTFESETNRLIRSRLLGGNSLCLHDSMVYKNMKLATMVESLQTFASCLDDTKWLFCESEKLIRELLVESNELYEESTLKRLRIDSIGKEYLRLKQRFDQIDMGEIKRIVASYMTGDALPTKPTPHDKENMQHQKQRKASSGTNISSSVKHFSHKELPGRAEKAEQEATRLRDKTAQLEGENTQHERTIKHLEIRISEGAERESQLKRQISELVHFSNDNSQAQLSTVDRLKTVLKRIRDNQSRPSEREMHIQLIDSLIVNLSVLQRRLRQEIASRNQTAGPELTELEVKKQLIRSQLNGLELEIANLRDQKQAIEAYVSKLQSYEQRRRNDDQDSFNVTTKSIKQHTKVQPAASDMELFAMLMVQAESIENLLDSQ